jgi:anaerobic magnesium-protoporphyrin IX monomethyl ester cyclase
MGIRVLFIVKDLMGSEPLGALYIAGSMMAAGHECRFTGSRNDEAIREMRRFAPHVVAYSATTGLHKYYLGLNAHLKEEFSFISLMGGAHPTYFPEVILTPGLDVICQGEGEDAAVELCNAIDQKQDFSRIHDLWVKQDGVVYKNPPRALRRDVDAIPFPPRHLLYEYDERLRQRPLKSFTTNRGCPFPCSYCFNPSLVVHYGSSWKKVRIRPPENVVAELSFVKSQGPLQVIGFRESIFVYSAAWLKEFGELYRREIGLPYYCHVRADMMTQEMVDLLAWSGCHTVNCGIETANEKLANDVLKRNIKMDKLVAGIKRLKKAGIVVFADNIVGIPSGTIEDDLATLQMNIDLDVDYAAATLCTPYPGTGIAKFAVENGYFDGDFESLDESYYTTSVIKFRSAQEKLQIENLQKLFAITAALPQLMPIVKQLIKLPENDFFYAAFRAWYVICHLTDVMPRRPDIKQLWENLMGVFGVYEAGDAIRYEIPEPELLKIIDSNERSAACGSTSPPTRLLLKERGAEERGGERLKSAEVVLHV